MLTTNDTYPRCIDGGRASSPENCGGPTGYLKMLSILRVPEASTYKSTRKKLDAIQAGPFDPEKFVPSELKFGDLKERYKMLYEEEVPDRAEDCAKIKDVLIWK